MEGLGPTIVRSALVWSQNGDCRSAGAPVPVVLDITGRKVMGLRPGPNDVRHLAPGVYFVRHGPAVRGVLVVR